MSDGLLDGKEMLVVWSAFETTDQATSVARVLLEERLCACVQCFPAVQSLYHWQGCLHSSAETAVCFKTTSRIVDRLVARLTALHPYEVPEIVVLPVQAVSAAYARWLYAETGGGTIDAAS